MSKTAVRLMVLIVALAMLLGVFAGCQQTTTADPTKAPAASNEQPSEGDAQEPGDEPETAELEEMEISIAVWAIMDSFKDGEMDMDDPLTKYIYDRFKIVWKPWDMTSGDYREKISVWSAANSLPDLFFADEKAGTNYPSWISSGLIRPIGTKESLAGYPNIMKVMDVETNIPFIREGEYWFFPRVTFYDRREGGIVGSTFITREDWMEKFGYTQEQVEGSVTEFTNMLKDFTLKDPDGNGVDDTFGYLPGGKGLDLFFERFGRSYGFNEFSIWVYDKNGNIYRAGMDYDAFRAAKYCREIYKAGYVAPNFIESGYSGTDMFVTSKGGIIGVHGCAKHYSRLKTETWDKAENGLDFEESTCLLLSPALDDGTGDLYVASYANAWSETYVPSTVDDAKMERILMWYEYAYSDEAAYLFLFGFEGQDWEFDENGKVKMLTELADDGLQKSANDLYTLAIAFQEAFVWYTDAYMYHNPFYVMADTSKAASDRMLATRKQCPIDYNLQAIQTDERSAFVTTLDWNWFITDTTDTSDEELYAQLLDDWKGAGYEAACDSLEKAFVEAGYEFQEQYFDVDERYAE